MHIQDGGHEQTLKWNISKTKGDKKYVQIKIYIEPKKHSTAQRAQYIGLKLLIKSCNFECNSSSKLVLWSFELDAILWRHDLT